MSKEVKSIRSWFKFSLDNKNMMIIWICLRGNKESLLNFGKNQRIKISSMHTIIPTIVWKLDLDNLYLL